MLLQNSDVWVWGWGEGLMKWFIWVYGLVIYQMLVWVFSGFWPCFLRNPFWKLGLGSLTNTKLVSFKFWCKKYIQKLWEIEYIQKQQTNTLKEVVMDVIWKCFMIKTTLVPCVLLGVMLCWFLFVLVFGV